MRKDLNKLKWSNVIVSIYEKRIVNDGRVGMFFRIRCKIFVISFDSMISFDSDSEFNM